MFRRLCCLASLLYLGFSVAASSEVRAAGTSSSSSTGALLGNVAQELAMPHRRCEEYDRNAGALDALHSYQRENIAHYQIMVGGREILRSGRDPLERVTVDRYLDTPDRIVVSARGGRWEKRGTLKEGATIEVFLVDKQGERFMTFCGHVLRKDKSKKGRTSVVNLYAYRSRPDDLFVARRDWREMRESDIISAIAAENGLVSDLHAGRTVRNQVQRVPDWQFMQKLASSAGQALRIEGGEVKTRPWSATSFAGGPTRTWREMRDSDVAIALAGEMGLQADVEPTTTVRSIIRNRGRRTWEFLHRRAAIDGFSAYRRGSKLRYVPGEGMPARSAQPSVPSDPGGAPAKLSSETQIERIEVVWEPGTNGRYQRRSVRKSKLAVTRLRLAASSKPVSSSVAATPPGALGLAATRAKLDKVIRALTRRYAQDREATFLLKVADQYRPTLIYHHRARKGGMVELDRLLRGR